MIYLIVFWVIQLAAAALMIVAIRRPSVGRRGLLLLLTALPLALCLLWGIRFGVEPGSSGADEESLIAGAPAGFALASVVICVALIFSLRGARLIAAAVGLLEVPSTLMVAFLATMQVTGSWI